MKPWVRSAAAIVFGFLVTAVASVATDAVMHATRIFPNSPQAMSDPLFILASGYRALFTIAGGFVTARLVPDRPMRHVWILAGIGVVAGLAGVAIYFLVGRAHIGPAWYPISIAVEALPCVWFGGRLAAGLRNR
jgi:hypothetical protein